MDQDHLHNRSIGMSHDPERARNAVANGATGYDGIFDRSNGLENDISSGELPYALFDTTIESGKHAAEYVSNCVSRDIKIHGVEQMLDVEFALDKALVAYGVQLADTPYHLETAVAEYFGSLSEFLLDSDNSDVSAQALENFITETAEQLTALDQLVSAQ